MYTLDQIVRSGKVRYIGGSTMPAYKFAQMILIADWKGYARPIAMQNLYNLIQREEGGETERSRNDVQVKAGVYRDCDWQIAERLKKVAASKGCTPAQVALAWLLSKSYMAAPIIGATSLDQLDSAAKATEITLTPAETKQLEEPYEFRVSP